MSFLPQKNYLLMRDVITKYHPDFVNSEELRKYGLTHSHIFNCERLVEEALAAVGGYTFVDEEGRDFDDIDDSDSKTVSIQPSRPVMEINGVENKIGSLRITVYNPLKEGLDYLYVPKSDLKVLKEPCYGKMSHRERLKTSYNSIYDSYNRLQPYRVDSFEDLAKAQD